jgi:hypothetical protein
MPTHVENYYIDDRTPVEFLSTIYNPGDVIVTDYWMQDVYLKLLTNRKSDYFLSRWDISGFLNKFPAYKLYNNNYIYRISEKGPIFITDLDQIKLEKEKKIWYISSSDFINRKYEYISNDMTCDWLQQKNITPYYVGKDGNSKIYLIK